MTPTQPHDRDATPTLRLIRAAGQIPRFYMDGFRDMTVGRSLWIIIAIKVIILFGVLKLFFFPDLLATRFNNDADRSSYVLEQLLAQPDSNGPNTEGESDDRKL